MQSLEKLIKSFSGRRIVVIGGGPSLDFCMEEINDLAVSDSVFLLVDIVSEKFIKLYPDTNRIIFTLESRSHNYLRALKNEKIACYVKSRRSNYYENLNECYQFHFDIDTDYPRENSFQMLSPGTVAGAAIFFALSMAMTALTRNTPVILFGIDLFYIDNQVYNRLCKYEIIRDFWTNRESREWVGVLRRTSYIEIINGSMVRTSAEFLVTRTNLQLLIQKFNKVVVMDYSPLGISPEYVKKMVPKKISSEINRDIIR